VARSRAPRPAGRVRHQAQHQPDDERVHPGLEDGEPGRRAEHQGERGAPDAQPDEHEDRGQEQDGDEERHHRDPPGVRHGDHDQGDQVVHDQERDHVGAEPLPVARTDHRQQPEREGGVRRHRRAPAVGRGPALVQRQVDRDRRHHARDAGEDRQRDPAALAQLADVELAARLEAHDEEEERHQAVVHPQAQVLRHAQAADVDRDAHLPQGVVRGPVEVVPRQRDQDRDEQDRSAPRLVGQEPPQRHLAIAGPDGQPGLRRFVLHGHVRIVGSSRRIRPLARR
jgi:hypothetical protein